MGGVVEGAALPGVGGVNRGRGDAELTWGEEAGGSAERFQPTALDPARYLDPASSALIGVGSTSPPVTPEAEAGGLGPVEGSAGGQAWRRRLAPRHRQAVRGFFGPAAPGKDEE